MALDLPRVQRVVEGSVSERVGEWVVEGDSGSSMCVLLWCCTAGAGIRRTSGRYLTHLADDGLVAALEHDLEVLRELLRSEGHTHMPRHHEAARGHIRPAPYFVCMYVCRGTARIDRQMPVRTMRLQHLQPHHASCESVPSTHPEDGGAELDGELDRLADVQQAGPGREDEGGGE